MNPLRRLPVLLFALALGVSACGGGGDDSASSNSGGDSGDSDLASQCPIGAIDDLDAGQKPVEITYWHSFPEENERLITEITDDFNASQDDVRVKLVNQTDYEDTLTAFRAAYGKSGTPDLVLLQDSETQQMIDSQAVIPAQACVDADDYDTSDILKRVTDYYTVDGALWPMPFNVSNPVLYYNRAVFTAAGLDPNQPPKTLDDIKSASQKIVDAGAAPHGWALKLDPWLLEEWTAMANEPYVDHDNGRNERATKVLFDNPVGVDIFTWMQDMVDSGLAENVGRPKGNLNHYLAVANKSSAMTADTSAALGTVLAVLGSGQYPDVDLGVAPLPGPSDGGATFVAGGANYIVKGDAPEKVEAAWRFAKYLDEPEVQAKWSASGYIPIRKAAANQPAVQQLWQNPFYRVAYDQLANDVDSVAATGPVIGDFTGVRDAVVDSMEQMITNHVAPEDALDTAKKKADEAIADYNTRAG